MHAGAIEGSGPVRGGRLKSAELSCAADVWRLEVGMTKRWTWSCAVQCINQDGLASLHNLCQAVRMFEPLLLCQRLELGFVCVFYVRVNMN